MSDSVQESSADYGSETHQQEENKEEEVKEEEEKNHISDSESEGNVEGVVAEE